MEEWREYNYRLYDELHCPFCGSTDITDWKESFNHRAAFWGVFFFMSRVFCLAVFVAKGQCVSVIDVVMNSRFINTNDV